MQTDTKINEIADYLKCLFPGYLSEDWDNNGLLLGDGNNTVKKVFICLDLNTESFEEIKTFKPQLVITHHPVIFKGIKDLSTLSYQGSVLSYLIKSDISVYSVHTPADAAEGGLNDFLLEVLLKNQELNCPKPRIQELKNHELDYPKLKSDQNIPMNNAKYLRIGTLKKPWPAIDFLLHVKNKLNIGLISYIGKIPDVIEKVAVFTGSFDTEMVPFNSLSCDALITGDIKYHTAREAENEGVFIINAGHFATEKIFCDLIRQRLVYKFPYLDITVSQKERDPFTFV